MNNLLVDSLETAIMLHVPEFHKVPLADLQKNLEATASETAQLIAEKGDVLMFGGGKKGEVATIFNQVAKAMALMSVVIPGGVPFAGRTFCYPHPELK